MVPQNRYDRAVDRADAEQAQRVRVEAKLAAARADVQRLEALLSERSRHVDARDQMLSRSKLDEARLETERDDAAALVEQLRGELARAGDHLREYSEQKHALEAALAEAALGSATPPAEAPVKAAEPPAKAAELPVKAAEPPVKAADVPTKAAVDEPKGSPPSQGDLPLESDDDVD